ncbi:MAG: fibronectin type III domain-containing protein [Spirochaetes bacterium]|uniref:Fibronectin type III domain-containing protein n=1 Tax=Candidatus Ornithospirochaeta stercoripullorum TaxID=2840899 RepID=A0A9D9DZW7_9SPIO|nr:fibronectin type III domain-containing protein [Candidatus Ornithospirochaeta stercoripullorum]
MTKIASIVAFLMLLAGSLSASGLEAAAVAYPSSADISWKEVDGAVWYDIYSGEDFIVRLDSTSREYSVKKLLSDTDYSFSVAARTADNITLDADFLSVTTTSWDGIYEWNNKTADDNKGKVTNIKMRVETAYAPQIGQYHKIYMYNDSGKDIQIFPLYDFSDSSSGEWVDYNSKTAAGNSYRFNAGRFNASIFTPSKWRVDKVMIDYDSSSAYIQTSALGLVFDTVTSYKLFIEEGKMKMSFATEGSGIVGGFLFRNPNPGEGDAFILTRIE